MSEVTDRYKEVISVARSSSLEPKVGALIYDSDGNRLGGGWNRVVVGDKWPEVANELICTNHDGDNINSFIYHAEAYAIQTLLMEGCDLNGCTIYVAGKHPCIDCAKQIALAGIKEVHCPPRDTNSRWVESNRDAYNLLTLKGIKVVYSDELKGLKEGLTCASKYSSK